MSTAAFIFARGGSQGVPGKNIRDLAGKPLLAYSIEVARELPSVERIYVSTDDERIAKVAGKYGAEVIERPAELATSISPEWLSWRHALQALAAIKVQPDVFLSLPPTSPLRIADDVQKCLDKLDSETDIVVTMTESRRSPWFNMVKEEGEYIRLLIKKDQKVYRRQDSPTSYDLTTVAYVAKPEFLLTADSIFEGRVKGVEVPPERAIDIDTELDFAVAEYLMNRRLSNA